MFQLDPLSAIGSQKLAELKNKSSKGYQMLRFPRAGSTATIYAMNKAFGIDEWNPTNEKFLMLGCCSFNQMPFSWGPDHYKLLDFPRDIPPGHLQYSKIYQDRVDRSLSNGWIRTFNGAPNKKPGFDSNKLTFQVVRNPFDWLISMYKWDFMGLKEISRERTGISFEGFIRKYLDVKESHTWHKKIEQSFPWPMMDKCFFQPFDDDNHCHVDVFIRFEFLQKGLDKLFELGDYPPSKIPVGIPSLDTKITNKDKLPYNDYKSNFYVSGELVHLVERAYEWDLKTFNYGYNGVKDSIPIFASRNGP